MCCAEWYQFSYSDHAWYVSANLLSDGSKKVVPHRSVSNHNSICVRDVTLNTTPPSSSLRCRYIYFSIFYYFRQCNQCQPGFWSFPDCRVCQCNDHASICDQKTGACIECRDLTDGYYCDRCKVTI